MVELFGTYDVSIKRHNISKDVSKEMNKFEDFFHSVAKAHVTAADMHCFDM